MNGLRNNPEKISQDTMNLHDCSAD